PDAAVPDDLFRAVVQVLAAWGWARRPGAVVAVASRHRPQLVASLARRIAEVGRLPFLGELPRTPGHPGGPAGETNSVQRLAAVHGAFTLPDELARAVAGLGAPVLLVDDVIASGWTVTVAARLLRQAGAEAVLPFALAVDG
ncbi:MAG: recombinase RecQ, partial [Micromonosporaceae bacterium]